MRQCWRIWRGLSSSELFRDALKRLAMPAKDIYHETVKNALLKDGWTITHDPLVLRWGTTDVYVDLGAEQPPPAFPNRPSRGPRTGKRLRPQPHASSAA